ncbi:UdgX family uracil-DNA binding protein [Ottowia sp. GY511]|uniref:Type-4 uracil-DNA glycosylase n=1 Tax=Ottowia flava TaxID=2675430 RepID=A0ABW4KZC9_9BURK|nr:UdgX family uracil-DNA binding protein [Ottowia sp. GY511]TXK23417.1 UdgX family uracil-DNA binding protein [Ottowia sp. GY511]
MIPAELPHPAARHDALRLMQTFAQQSIPWDAVDWFCGDDYAGAGLDDDRLIALEGVSTRFIETASLALLHSDEDRFMRVHAMLERIRKDGRHWNDVLHPEHVHLQALARQVRRDMHKMKAFVRFTRVARSGHEEYVAWFEPRHFVTQATAGFFQRRFATMRWTILTPVGSVRWNGEELIAGPAANRADAPATDSGEALWLTYYERIFNPARIKLNAMRKEMPVHYWKNLPEASRIGPMLAAAPRRVQEMVSHHADTERASAVRSASKPADKLASLNVRIGRCDRCDLALYATQAVPGQGPSGAKIMLVGEQPGDKEDLTGQPFIGPAGQLLRVALDQIGISMADVFVTNAVKHFKYEMRGKRRIHKTPGQREVTECAQWLNDEISIVRPEVVIALGRTAQSALELVHPVRSTPWQTEAGAPIHVVAHPAALLRSGEEVGTAGFCRWRDQLRQCIETGQAKPG